MFLFYPFILRFTPQKTISILYALMRIILFQIYIPIYIAQKTISMCIGCITLYVELAFRCAKFNLFHTLNNTFLHSYSHGTICMYILFQHNGGLKTKLCSYNVCVVKNHSTTPSTIDNLSSWTIAKYYGKSFVYMTTPYQMVLSPRVDK